MSPVTIIQADDVTPQPWRNGGGQTRELLVWPTQDNKAAQHDIGTTSTSGSLGGTALCVGKGGARDAGGGHGAERSATQTPSANQESSSARGWQLRISRADIGASGPFSAFDGVQRWFVVLSGNGVVLHMPTTDGHTLDHTLLPGHTPLHFDGGLAPGCTLIDGPTQDLNLMARGGTACVLAAESGVDWTSAHTLCGLYTACSGTWTDGQHTQALAAHSLLWLPPTEAAGHPPMRFHSDTHSPAAWWLGYTPEATP